MDLVTLHDGKLEGPFEWTYGDWCEDGGERGDVRYESVEACLEDHAHRGSLSGTFADGVAQGTLVISNQRHTHEISLVPGVAIEIAELDADPNTARDYVDLLGPLHRWNGWPRCAYANDTAVHRGHGQSR
jgi:hypothetical protein